MTYEIGTRKAVQVESTDVWEPDPGFNPDYGVIQGTDGVNYLVLINNPEPEDMEMVILELALQNEEGDFWNIVTNQKNTDQ